jgi:hypothetical protein
MRAPARPHLHGLHLLPALQRLLGRGAHELLQAAALREERVARHGRAEAAGLQVCVCKVFQVAGGAPGQVGVGHRAPLVAVELQTLRVWARGARKGHGESGR